MGVRVWVWVWVCEGEGVSITIFCVQYIIYVNVVHG